MPNSPAPAAPRRRLLMIEFFARGGLFHYSWQLAEGLARAAAPGLEVVLLTGPDPEASPREGGPRLLPTLGTWNPHRRPRGLPRRLLRAWRGLVYLLAWGRVLAAVRRERPQAVLLGDFEHRCDAWGVGLLAAWCRRHGVCLGDIWHNPLAFERNRPGRLVRTSAWRLGMARRFDVVFVHGRTLAAEFERLTGCRARPIVHGDEGWLLAQAGADPGLALRLGLPPGAPVALLFGALSAYKGVEVLLEALAVMAAEARPVVIVAGMPTAGVRPEAWRERARALQIEPWVRWDLRYIPVAETAWYAGRADFVVLPYLAASQSGVAHLALTAGKPLVVTRVGGLAELIAGNGLVVEPGDRQGLAQAIERLSRSPDLCRQMGRRSHELARTRHAWEAIAGDVLDGLKLGGGDSARHGTAAAVERAPGTG